MGSLSVGVLLIGLGGSERLDFVDPGEVTFEHGGVESCAGCHSAADVGPSAWPRAAVTPAVALTDSQRCLGCHRLGADGLAPHGMAAAGLRALTERGSKASTPSVPFALRVSNGIAGLKQGPEGKLSCATCHQEHRGKSARLGDVPNLRCMRCHQAQFASLSDGHPEFTGFPFERRTRIAFDHTSHFRVHFRDQEFKEMAPSGCIACHGPEATGRAMLSLPYEAVCASCHGAQIEGAGRATAKGIEILGVPGLDVFSLADHDTAIGSWPEDADGALTPFMDVLLSADPAYRAARETLAGVDLLELGDGEPDRIGAVEALAWAVKALFSDLAAQGVPALRERLAVALGRPIESADLAGLTGSLPAEAVRGATRAWFPDLHREVGRHRAGERVTGAAMATAEPEPTPEPVAEEAGDDGDILAADDGDILAGDDGDILAGDDGDILAGDDGDILAGDDGDILAGDGDDILAGDTDDPEADDADGAIEETIERAAPEDWAAAGGWYRDGFALRYRPTGHADRFLATWLSAAGKATAAPGAPGARAIFESLADPNAPGRCVKCHGVEAAGPAADPDFTVNWSSARPSKDRRDFTTFSHVAHFSLLDEEGCLSCHELNEPEGADTEKVSPTMAGFADRNPMTFTSNFHSIERKTCVRCHTESEAGDSCLSCHNYHVGLFPPAMVSAPKVMTGKAEN